MEARLTTFGSRQGHMGRLGSKASQYNDIVTLTDQIVKQLRENKKLVEEFKRSRISVNISKKISIEKLLARIVGFSKNVQQFHLKSLKYPATHSKLSLSFQNQK